MLGYTSVDAKVSPKQKVVYRVQNAWVPLEKGQKERKIAPAHYSYQTLDRSNPRNLLVLGTAQGIFVHSDDRGVHKLMAHSTKGDGEPVSTHWFTAEASETMVGRATTKAETSVGEGKARAVEMGVKGMGARANCFVVMSIPNRQAVRAAA